MLRIRNLAYRVQSPARYHCASETSYPTSPTVGNNRAETCLLCKDDEESTMHFLLHCQALSEARQPCLPKILNTCRNNSISIDSDTLVKIILDTTYLPSIDENHEVTCRNMVYRLYKPGVRSFSWGRYELQKLTRIDRVYRQLKVSFTNQQNFSRPQKKLSALLANDSKRWYKQEKKKA